MKKFLFAGTILTLAACHGGGAKSSEDGDAAVKTVTPVTVTTISTGLLTEYTDLSATSQFMQKNYVKANVNGYIQSVSTQVGKQVSTGDVLFTLKTKEAQSIGNAVNKLNPSFRFSGISTIKATTFGFVSQLSHQTGDYVQDGEQLAIINDASSFAFILNLPYELRPFVLNQKTVLLTLPDSTTLNGTIASVIPSVDPASQTQQVVIKVPNSSTLPENLIARVRVVKTAHSAAASVPKGAVLTDETQTEYWVMKVLNDSTAVKVPVTIGVQTKDAIELLKPQFSAQDRIVMSGNYGLPDTAGIKITATPQP